MTTPPPGRWPPHPTATYSPQPPRRSKTPSVLAVAVLLAMVAALALVAVVLGTGATGGESDRSADTATGPVDASGKATYLDSAAVQADWSTWFRATYGG